MWGRRLFALQVESSVFSKESQAKGAIPVGQDIKIFTGDNTFKMRFSFTTRVSDYHRSERSIDKSEVTV